MEFEQISALLFKIHHDGTPYLGIRIGKQKAIGRNNLLQIRQFTPYLYSSDQFQQWKITGFASFEGTIIAYGSWLDNPVVMTESLYTLEQPVALPMLGTLLEVMDHQNNPLPLPEAFSSLQFIITSTGILQLPNDMVQLIEHMLEPAERLRVVDPYLAVQSAPGLALHTGLAVLLYRIISDEFPFEQSQELSSNVRKIAGLYVPLALHRISLDKADEAFIEANLSGTPKVPAFADWLAVLKHLQANPPQKSDTETAAFLARRTQYQKRITKLARREFWRKRGPRVALIAAAALFVLSVPFAGIGALFKESLIKGLQPQQIVDGFYAAVNRLDIAYMEDALNNKTQTVGLYNETEIMAATEKARIAMEERIVLLNPKDWVKKGALEIPGHLMVFGHDKLMIQKIDSNETTVHYNVTYEWYNSMTTNMNPQKFIPIAHQRHDTVVLTRSEEGWFISSLSTSEASSPVQP